MNAQRLRSLTLAGILLLVLPTVLASRAAHAAVPDVWAFAYNDNPTPAPGSVMNLAYQGGSFQTVCPGSMATITQVAIGKYMVFFPCSASSNGIVHVTAVNGAARYCEIEGWTDSGGSKAVTVLCFQGASPANSKFTVTYTRSSGTTTSGAHAYVYSAPSGALIASYNSGGLANTVTHIGTGRWEVNIPLTSPPTSYDGDLQATAVHPNDSPRRCKIDNWYYVGSSYRAPISCTDPSGALTDTWFTFSYHFKRAVFGKLPGLVAYMTNLSGAPAGSAFDSGCMPVSFVAIPPGRYKMHFPCVGTGATHMQVTALGGPFGYYCQLENIWTMSGGDVDAPAICYDNAGVPTDNFLFSSFASNL